MVHNLELLFGPLLTFLFIIMLSYLARYLYRVIRSIRLSKSEITYSSTNDKRSNSNCKQSSAKSSDTLSTDQSILKPIKQSIRKSTKVSIKPSTNLSDQLIIHGLDKMPRKQNTKFDELCKDFEIRLQNSVKVMNSKVNVESKETNKTIIIDDDVEEEIINLIKQNGKENNKRKRKEVKLFRNITNTQTTTTTISSSTVNKSARSTKNTQNEIQIEKAFKSVENLQQTELVEVLDDDKSKLDTVDTTVDKNKYKNLKPENFRIQQVIKQEDLVYFDVETGGMGSKEDILQIGAINHEGKKFNMYATPTKPIPGMSSRIHHITYKDNQMFYRKKPVEHHSIIEVLLQFLDYLEKCKSNNIVLIAHNANFDRRFIIEKLFLYNLQSKLNSKVVGFVDTLPMFRRLIPGQETYKQDALIYSFYPQTKTDFHNALTDVIYLKKLFERVASEKMKQEVKYINDFSQSLEYGFLKMEQKLFEEMAKKVSKKSSSENASKKRKKASGIFINGEHQQTKRVKKTRSSTASEPTRRSKRLKK